MSEERGKTAGATDALGFPKQGARKLTPDEIRERYHKAYVNWRAATASVEHLKYENRMLRKRVDELKRLADRRDLTITAMKAMMKEVVERADVL